MTLVGSRPSDKTSGRALVSSIRSLVLLSCAAVAGLGVAEVLDLGQIHQSSGYFQVVTILLAIGLYGSTSGIPIPEMKRNWRTILLAVTIGVLAKAALIATVMLWVVDDPIYAMLLGVAVAQIDPLAVAALVDDARMSKSAKTVLRAWSSFDDPVTTILTVYLLTFTGWSGASSSRASAEPLALAGGFAENLGFALVVWLAYRMAKRVGRLPAFRALNTRPAAVRAVGVLALLGVGFVAVQQFYLLGLAIVGLFLRPAIEPVLERLTKVALLLATAALGMLLVGGVDWRAGITLGVSAYFAQVLLAPLVARRHSFADRVQLALGQQNGITAITLALLVEPVFPGTVSVIAPAILVINGLHAAGTVVGDRVSARQSRIRAGEEPKAEIPGRKSVPAVPFLSYSAWPGLTPGAVPLVPHIVESPAVDDPSRQAG